MCLGSSGMFEQDDVENWVSITDMAGGSLARRLLLSSRMGLNSQDKRHHRHHRRFRGGTGIA
jgi:phthalate 3,4-dioxygenase subunit alpha